MLTVSSSNIQRIPVTDISYNYLTYYEQTPSICWGLFFYPFQKRLKATSENSGFFGTVSYADIRDSIQQ